jgi:hypothetical protein
MRKILVLGASLALLSMTALAESWNGTLVDATCAMQNQQGQQGQSQPYQQSQPNQRSQSQSTEPGQSGQYGQSQQQGSSSYSACEPTSTTTAFALRTSSGQTYQLDDAGNAKVITAMKDRADRMKDEGMPSTSQTTTPVHATVKGTLNNNIIKVDSVQVQ